MNWNARARAESVAQGLAHEIQRTEQALPSAPIHSSATKKMFQIVLKVASLNETYFLCRALTFSTNHFEFPFRRQVQSETDDAKIKITRQPSA
jgi:hypothetical protein